MATTKQSEVQELITVLAANNPEVPAGEVFHAASNLLRLARAHHHLAELDCNEGLTDADQRRVERIEREIRDYASPYATGVKFQGDPRGCTVGLLLKNGKWNSWGGEEDGWKI